MIDLLTSLKPTSSDVRLRKAVSVVKQCRVLKYPAKISRILCAHSYAYGSLTLATSKFEVSVVHWFATCALTHVNGHPHSQVWRLASACHYPFTCAIFSHVSLWGCAHYRSAICKGIMIPRGTLVFHHNHKLVLRCTWTYRVRWMHLQCIHPSMQLSSNIFVFVGSYEWSTTEWWAN